MSATEAFIAELTQEAATTRRVLERVPEGQLSWRPHPKSMSLGQLAAHIAGLPRGIALLLKELTVEPPRVPLPEPTSTAEIVALLDEAVPFAIERLKEWGDEGLAQVWSLSRGGKTLLQLPRLAVFRSVMLNHWYHHRGQLTVYLRLLDVALPSVYGPTADDQIFG